MADLTRDDIYKLAMLARLDLSEAEADEFTAEIAEILQYVEQLDAIDVTGLEPTLQVTGSVNVGRDDKVIDYGYIAADLLNNVPRVANDGHIIVNRMLA